MCSSIPHHVDCVQAGIKAGAIGAGRPYGVQVRNPEDALVVGIG